MSEFIWYWTKGNKKVYTTQVEQAEQALKEGYFVMGSRLSPDSRLGVSPRGCPTEVF